MKKKIDFFWYWFIFVVAFVLCFFAVNDKKVNAYHLDSNGNLVSDNVLQLRDATFSYNGLTYVIKDGIFTINGTAGSGGSYWYFNSYTNITSIPSGDYTIFKAFISGTTSNNSSNITIRTASQQYYVQLGSSHGDIKYKENMEPLTNISFYAPAGTVLNNYSFALMITKGENVPASFEPYGAIWYSPTNAENMYQGKLPNFTSSLTYTNQDTGVTSTINDLNSYIDNSFGYLYFDRLWTYLDNLTGSSYDDAKLTINFSENLNINTSYIINSNKENYGSGVWFYQNNDLMLDVRNFYDNDYCVGSSQYSCNVDLNKYVNVGSGSNSFSYLNKVVVWSATTDERTLAFGYNNIGYNTGYDNGYIVGYKDGKNVSDNSIYNIGYTNGYNVGYDKGVNYASNGGNTLVGLVGAIFTAPVNMLQTIFDFEFLGINLTSFLFSLISLFIVIWLIRKFL